MHGPSHDADTLSEGACRFLWVCLDLPLLQVVSGDHQSNVCVWEVDSGRMRFRFGGDQEKITAMTFDKTGRRLLTGSVSGVVKMWNFSNGGCLKTLMPSEASGGDEVDAPTVSLSASVPGFYTLLRNRQKPDVEKA